MVGQWGVVLLADGARFHPAHSAVFGAQTGREKTWRIQRSEQYERGNEEHDSVPQRHGCTSLWPGYGQLAGGAADVGVRPDPSWQQPGGELFERQ